MRSPHEVLRSFKCVADINPKPVQQAGSERFHPPDDRIYMPSSTTRILVVDDDHLTLTLLTAMLKREGFNNVEVAKNGRDSLKKFLVQKPHIVFLDIEMPELDGIETLRAIKDYGITTQIVMVSATATADRVSAAQKGGASGFIVKPASQKRMADAIHACLKRASKEEGDIELFILQ